MKKSKPKQPKRPSKLAGSGELFGDLEKASQETTQSLLDSLETSARQLSPEALASLKKGIAQAEAGLLVTIDLGPDEDDETD